MDRIIITLVFFTISTFSFAQSEYKKTGKYDEYNKDWALVKTIAGTYGFINRNNEIVVQPIYEKIEKFSKELWQIHSLLLNRTQRNEED